MNSPTIDVSSLFSSFGPLLSLVGHDLDESDGPEHPSHSSSQSSGSAGNSGGSTPAFLLDLDPELQKLLEGAYEQAEAPSLAGSHAPSQDDDADGAAAPPSEINVNLEVNITNQVLVLLNLDDDERFVWDSEEDLGPAQEAGPLGRRRLHQFEDGLGSLNELLARSERLEDKAHQLSDKAADLKEAGQTLLDGITPGILRKRAKMVLDLADDRAQSYESKAERLDKEAEKLEEKGDRRSLRLARLKRHEAAELRDFAEELLAKAGDRADDLKARSRRLADIINRFDLPDEDDRDTRKNELKEAGKLLLRVSNRVKAKADRLLEESKRLREIWRDVWGKVTGRRALHTDALYA